MLNSQLILDFPTLFKNTAHSMVGFKVRRVGEPSFITVADNNPTYEEAQEGVALEIPSNQATVDTVNQIKQTPWNLSNKKTLMVRPNPASDYCEVVYSGSITKDTKLLITTTEGSIIKSMQVTSTIERIDLNGFASGSYLLTITSNSKTYVTKLIIK